VKFYAFHLMPYRAVDLEAAAKYRSHWVVLPNDFYDPEKGSELYREYIEQLVYAANAGFDGICVNEHHQTAYGMMPAPNLLASVLIERTRDLPVKVAILGRALPLVSNPLTIAEEFAMLDVLSKGRVITGFVRGIGAEYHTMGVNPIFSHDRFHEAHDLIVRAWTETGPFAFEGEHYNFRYVNVWPRPYQRPHPPIWIPSQGSRETIEWAARPEHKYPFIITFSPLASVLRYHKMYRDQAEKYGYEVAGEQLGWATPIYVAETDEIARREAGPHIESLFNNFLRMTPEMLFPPGYTSMASFLAIMANRKGTAFKPLSVDELNESGTFVVGSPATVRARLEEAHAQSGFKTAICMLQFGTLPDELVRKNTQMFAEEVMPKLRHL
jgi:alkanesulfonate monooxygenase SsuD/methylene tetrahydromethanopterin reductase-like flavin-dependent oxidoreductase (luciferase family)